ncbi:MAG: CPBP family intramembrane metalloprotease [Ruminococcaceae bacterium]|nr:CPBP family intramembrane metalloprotease [Oscillospiraceae bacterium]
MKKRLEKFELRPSLLVLFVYIMLLFSRFLVGGLEAGTSQYLAAVILQLLTFLIPAVLFYRLRTTGRFPLEPQKRIRYIKRLRMTPPSARHALIIAAAVLALIAGCLLFSISFDGGSSFEGNFTLYDTFAAKKDGTALGALGLVLAYAVLPAVCEELVFRGIICAEYEGRGVIFSFTMSTFFFALLHFNPEKLLSHVFAGLVLAALLYATRSVFSCMIAHFLYNIFGIFGQQYITEFYITSGSLGVFIFIMITVLILAAAVFCGQAARLYRRYSVKDAPSDYREPHTRAELSAAFAEVIKTPSVIACVALYVVFVIINLII